MKIAIACSGLGHIQRGVEAWALDTAEGLGRAGIDVTLFTGAPVEARVPTVAVACLRRNDAGARLAQAVFSRLGGWRYLMGSTYDIEQVTFSLRLWPKIRRRFDILHSQDPFVALLLQRFWNAGLSRPCVALGNGSTISPRLLDKISVVHELTPPAFEEHRARATPGRLVQLIPNFIDTTKFRPGDRDAARDRFGLPRNAVIVLTCAAIRRFHKRLDYVVQAFAEFAQSPEARDAILVVAGAREVDTDEIMQLGRERLDDRVRFLVDLPRSDMADLYQAADVFVLGSLFEGFGIVLIEAMATGLPVACHDTATFRYVVGDGGRFADLTKLSGLAEALRPLMDPGTRSEVSKRARSYAERNFSEAAVIPQMIQMYRNALEVPRHAANR